LMNVIYPGSAGIGYNGAQGRRLQHPPSRAQRASVVFDGMSWMLSRL
jgi:hypothetical protein